MSTYNIEIIRLPVIDSTNNFLKSLAKDGVNTPVVVIADEQTGGRGTKNRSFISKKGGIYLSILIKSQEKGFNSTLITPMTAVAVSDTIEQIANINTGIKWVNDIYIDNKKVAGILCESVILPEDENPHIIVGIGVNLFKPCGGFEKEIEDIAISVYDNPDEAIKEEFINLLLKNFFKYYENIGSKTFLEKYKLKNLVLGEKVTVIQGENRFPAKAIDIDDNCRLLVELSDKSHKWLNSGEVIFEIKQP